MLSILILALTITPVQLQPDDVPMYCTSSIDDQGRSSGVICKPLQMPGSIDPQSNPVCENVCPIGNSGQPEEPIGQQ